MKLNILALILVAVLGVAEIVLLRAYVNALSREVSYVGYIEFLKASCRQLTVTR